ncbi:unnamed protein product [Paramecium pentaurelia]|uniref:Uncharacterized protein n=1 Tax=Paramecium pentaurelia TaxID=43138 RepID=A0A8S1TDF7_9CILI|nr:unnamed protein product [Paramecium pentaurelia]
MLTYYQEFLEKGKNYSLITKKFFINFKKKTKIYLKEFVNQKFDQKRRKCKQKFLFVYKKYKAIEYSLLKIS